MSSQPHFVYTITSTKTQKIVDAFPMYVFILIAYQQKSHIADVHLCTQHFGALSTYMFICMAFIYTAMQNWRRLVDFSQSKIIILLIPPDIVLGVFFSLLLVLPLWYSKFYILLTCCNNNNKKVKRNFLSIVVNIETK